MDPQRGGEGLEDGRNGNIRGFLGDRHMATTEPLEFRNAIPGKTEMGKTTGGGYGGDAFWNAVGSTGAKDR